MAAPALHEIYTAHKDAVWNAAVHLTGDASAAEDVVHDVFAALLSGRVPLPHTPRAWLLTAVLNRVRDRARRRAPIDGVDLGAVPAPAIGPDLAAIVGERAAQVAAALAELPLPQREVVVLHVFEEMPFRTIGELCGTSQDTVASRWRYACAKLRHRLADLGVQA